MVIIGSMNKVPEKCSDCPIKYPRINYYHNVYPEMYIICPILDGRVPFKSREKYCPLYEIEAISKENIKDMIKELESMPTEDVEFTHGLIQNGVLLDNVLKIVHKYCDGE